MQNTLAILMTQHELLVAITACSVYTCRHTQAKQVGKDQQTSAYMYRRSDPRFI